MVEEQQHFCTMLTPSVKMPVRFVYLLTGLVWKLRILSHYPHRTVIHSKALNSQSRITSTALF